jgi:hypothetical protein
MLTGSLEFLRRAPVVSPTIAVSVCRDPEDNKFLEAAIAAGAEYVVTSDRDPGEYEGVKIRFPAELLQAVGDTLIIYAATFRRPQRRPLPLLICQVSNGIVAIICSIDNNIKEPSVTLH